MIDGRQKHLGLLSFDESVSELRMLTTSHQKASHHPRVIPITDILTGSQNRNQSLFLQVSKMMSVSVCRSIIPVNCTRLYITLSPPKSRFIHLRSLRPHLRLPWQVAPSITIRVHFLYCQPLLISNIYVCLCLFYFCKLFLGRQHLLSPLNCYPGMISNIHQIYFIFASC